MICLASNFVAVKSNSIENCSQTAKERNDIARRILIYFSDVGFASSPIPCGHGSRDETSEILVFHIGKSLISISYSQRSGLSLDESIILTRLTSVYSLYAGSAGRCCLAVRWQGNVSYDCVAASCCWPCVMCQMKRELDYVGLVDWLTLSSMLSSAAATFIVTSMSSSHPDSRLLLTYSPCTEEFMSWWSGIFA